MHPLELSRAAHLQPDQSKNIQARTQKNTKNIQTGPTSGRASPLLHAVATSPPIGSDGGEAAAHHCRRPLLSPPFRHRPPLPSGRASPLPPPPLPSDLAEGRAPSLLLLPLLYQIWQRGGCRLAALVGGEGGTIGARGCGGDGERVVREKGIRTTSSWSSRGDKDRREWIRRARLGSIF